MKSGKQLWHDEIESHVKNMIRRKPDYIKLYADSFSDKSVRTQEIYVKIAIEFVRYLRSDFNMDVWNEKFLKDIKLVHCTSYLKTYDDMSDNTRAQIAYAIKNFCEFLYDNEYVEKNPAQRLKAPKDRKTHEVTYLTKDEVKTMEERIRLGWTKQVKDSRNLFNRSVSPRNHHMILRDTTMFHLAIMTGLRVSEICNLDLSDIDLEEKTAKFIEKGGFERVIPLPDPVCEDLKKWIDDRSLFIARFRKDNDHRTSALFLNNHGMRITPREFGQLVKNWSMDIDKHITPHKLRSTYATNLYAQTKDIYLTAKMMNHKNIKNTMRYAVVTDEQEEDAANIAGHMYD